MVIEGGIGEMLVREVPKVLQGPVHRQRARGDSVEQVGQAAFVHEGVDCILRLSQKPR